ncbi:MAG: hypothetical protein KKB66_10860 [Alphaproteobacteria bacterium]|nr:hypothetical protein [Alphaproteobacteria bacterium]MBU0804901.1 hypothetical protein [Alphaproteobacteria bacterium]MBU0870400.1 hypothetical protein [Alphaproteobacteria bacterium]MBU1401925.1 hypothetical protein [Alphaproteobacteria bacterium]MBU1591658.1 hypothetical protein [Alphaproteobacteria bacterium]
MRRIISPDFGFKKYLVERSSLDVQTHGEIALVVDPNPEIHRKGTEVPSHPCSSHSSWRSGEPLVIIAGRRSIRIQASTVNKENRRAGKLAKGALKGECEYPRESGLIIPQLVL